LVELAVHAWDLGQPDVVDAGLCDGGPCPKKAANLPNAFTPGSYRAWLSTFECPRREIR
jgi:hypothetical protein